MKNVTGFMLALIMMISLSNCTRECTDCQNGECVQGVCKCDDYYTGYNCSSPISSLWEGKYEYKEYRTDFSNPPAVRDTLTYTFSISRGSEPYNIQITGLFSMPDVTLSADIFCLGGMCENYILSKRTTYGSSGLEIGSDGTYFLTKNPDGSLLIDYRMYQTGMSSYTYSCIGKAYKMQ